MDISWFLGTSGVYVVTWDGGFHAKYLLTHAVRSRSWESTEGGKDSISGHNYVGISCVFFIAHLLSG